MPGNTISKAVVALALGKRRYAQQVWLGLALVVGAAWTGYARRARHGPARLQSLTVRRSCRYASRPGMVGSQKAKAR